MKQRAVTQPGLATAMTLCVTLLLGLVPSLSFGKTGAIEKSHAYKSWRSYKLKFPEGSMYRAATIGTGGLTLALDHRHSNACRPDRITLVTRLKRPYGKRIRDAVPVSLRIDRRKVHKLTGVFSSEPGEKLGFLKIPATQFDSRLLLQIHDGLRMRARFRVPERQQAYAGSFSLVGSAVNMDRARTLCLGDVPATARNQKPLPHRKPGAPSKGPFALDRWRPLPSLVPDSGKYNPRKFDIAVFGIAKNVFGRCQQTSPYSLDNCILKRCSEYGPLRQACIKTIYMNTGKAKAPVPPPPPEKPFRRIPDPVIETYYQAGPEPLTDLPTA